MTSKVKRRPEPASSTLVPQMHRPAMNLKGEVDRMFDGLFPAMFGRSPLGFDPWRATGMAGLGSVVPGIDVKEYADRYEIAAELPGMDEKDVAVTVGDGVLRISGEKRIESDEKGAGRVVSERAFGSFERSFRLPEDSNADAIGAQYAKGVLTITVPRHDVPVSKDKKIEIKPH